MELEIILNGITRSFKPPPKTFLEFEYQLVDTFHLVSLKDCDIKYQDLENDMITISNNEEYTYMLNFFKSQNYKIIQIFVKEKSQSQILYSNSHNCKFDKNLGNYFIVNINIF